MIKEIYNPPRFTLVHKRSNRRIYIDRDTEYLSYDDEAFIVIRPDQAQPKLFF